VWLFHQVKSCRRNVFIQVLAGRLPAVLLMAAGPAIGKHFAYAHIIASGLQCAFDVSNAPPALRLPTDREA
ncbi:MAG: hypothetical protein J0I86_20550, partial [Mesorhizobium sp.]|nr:hypothetical protein [Mesorhizobium sp.]